VEGDVGDGWTLLRHAIYIEADSRDQGDSLHVDVTALLISRGLIRSVGTMAFPHWRRLAIGGTGSQSS
jgi:hypothetical protein